MLLGRTDAAEGSDSSIEIRVKRKSAGEPQHPAKFRRSSIQEKGRLGRRAPYAGRTASTQTIVLESGTHTDLEEKRGFEIITSPQRPLEASSSAKLASPETVRARRLERLRKLGGELSNVTNNIQTVSDNAEDAELPEAVSILEQAKEDLELVGGGVKEAQARIDEPYIPEAEINFELPEVPTVSPLSSLTLTSEYTWETAPNKRACQIRRSKSIKAAAKQIRAELGEPEYSYRDTEVRDMLWQLMDKIEYFAEEFFQFEIPMDMKRQTKAFQNMRPETVKIIGYVAGDGPFGAWGWTRLLTDRLKRKALICAIFGNVLVEQVFKHPCFGTDAPLLESLSKLEDELEDANGKIQLIRLSRDVSRLTRPLGFSRHHAIASYLRPLLFLSGTTLHPPPNFAPHTKLIIAALFTHLSPILFLSPNVEPWTLENKNLYQKLFDITTTAGLLSLIMRADPHTIYHFAPVCKDAAFDNKYMECFNHREMEKTHPRDPKTTWPPQTSEAEKKRAEFDEPLVQIKLMDGLTAYRRGGWETSSSDVWKPEWADKQNANKGVRSRVLTQQWVYCRWGRPQCNRKGEVQNDPRIHGVKNYREPGFVNFTDVEGVMERDLD